MVSQLTTYLTLYKSVSIPGIGSFALTRQPAIIKRAEEEVLPPSYLVQYFQKDEVPNQQLLHLAKEFHTDNTSAQQQLETFGQQLKSSLQKEPFLWKGIGRLEATESGINFYPEEITIDGWQPVAARKLVRENVSHTVLVGEKQVQSGKAKTEEVAKERKRFSLVLAGWILVVLAIAFIVFYFYSQGFSSVSTGSKQKFKVEKPAPTYK